MRSPRTGSAPASVAVAALAALATLAVAVAVPAQRGDGLDGLDAAGPGAAAVGWAWTAAGRCPYYCSCGQRDGLRRADCAGRRLGSVDLGLPADTEAADLGDNVIAVLGDGCFQEQGLVRLRELRLRHNAIHTVAALAFAGLRRLRHLDLSYNHLQSLHRDTFAGNKGLKTLLLAGNNLARLPVERPLLAAPRLQLLDLSGCRLAHLGAAVLAEMPALAHLNLSGNDLIQLQPQALARQQQLQVLDLTRNPLACDLNTRRQLQQLQVVSGRNVTVRHSCPAGQLGPPEAHLQSRHLARLLADVVPGGREGLAGEVVPGPDRGYRGPPPGPRPPRLTHQGMANAPEIESFDEEDLEESADRTTVALQTVELSPRDCPPLFPERVSKNPPPFKEWFDPIPSFWAGVFGCQVGLVLGLVLSSCACRLSFWRALCDCGGRRRPHRPASTESLDEDDADLEPSWSDISASCALCPYPAPPGAGGSPPGSARPSGASGARPETPPPSYHDLVSRQGLGS